MNTVIDLICQHRSIRAFTDQPLTDEERQAILAAGQAASTSSLIQAVSVIRITDADIRAQLAELAGHQAYVAQSAEFWVFCIDFQRHAALDNEIQPDFTELTLIGAIDAGIMAQNALLAAESLGLGGVYIGGLRNSAYEVDQLLKLPHNTAVLFGLCLGHPDQQPDLKPRLSPEVVMHTNAYQPATPQQIEEYDQRMEAYYAQRAGGQKQANWSAQMIDKLSKESRPHMLAYLQHKGLARR
ncbi:oxygen-insensitive NADPH nitroreductase [Marinospirillum sp. MEB164]|uniref:Oxygen-insensitive NADPH nitroreductase n=1 Tax=Marinospirillum alkalitolerans TaxID=3123374 RepID=A0ABW8PWU2_9GAMM